MKEIRTKIKSIQNTRKITRAMEMVAASKMRKAQERMQHARPYAEKIRTIAAHMSEANPEYHHPFMIPNTAKTSGIILMTTDKGLCGGLNTNILRLLLTKIQALEQTGNHVQLTVIGNKGLNFFARFGAKIVSQITHLGDTPHLEKLIGAIKIQLDAYADKKINALYLAYTRFINTMKQDPVIEQLLPLPKQLTHMAQSSDSVLKKANWDYLYEPDVRTVIDTLLVRYIETLIYQAVTENMASEQSARMVAMKAASDNAHQVIGELQLIYNKSRQASITKELAEIVGGAAAIH